MSQTSLEVKRKHRQYQVEDSPDSNEFTSVDPTDTFKGIYDNAHLYFDQDGGHHKKNVRRPVIMVAVVPDGFKKGTLVTTEGGVKKIISIGADFEGIPLLWLS